MRRNFEWVVILSSAFLDHFACKERHIMERVRECESRWNWAGSGFRYVSSVALDKVLNLPESSNVKMEIMAAGKRFVVHVM